MEEEGSDLLQMQTPPSKGKMKHPAAVAAAKKAIAAQQQESPAGVDKILAFSPPTKNEDVSEVLILHNYWFIHRISGMIVVYALG